MGYEIIAQRVEAIQKIKPLNTSDIKKSSYLNQTKK